MKIGVVGPCAAGKTTLISGLQAKGYTARHIAQEHSYVPDMWQRLANPDILIFLDVSFEISSLRRNMNWSLEEYNSQLSRLKHAQEHSNFYLQTDRLSIEDVLRKTLDFLEQFQTGHSE